jgi:endonuclease YncB( thermonuclease family)
MPGRAGWIFVGVILIASPAFGQSWVGPARVIDGDTLSVAGTRMRLVGIDAPEGPQGCQARDQRPYHCGLEAIQELARLIGTQAVHCRQAGWDARWRGPLVVCQAGKTDLNREMVRSGWAIAYRGGDYQQEQSEARAARRGLWQGPFQPPEEWRRSRPKTGPDTK